MLWMYIKLAYIASKRATWCRMFHNWRPQFFHGGYTRDICNHCKNDWTLAPNRR